MRILITRPRDDAGPLAEKLKARGHEVLVEPMLDIRLVPDAKVDLASVQAVLFTSANGVRAFAAAEKRRDLPALCVGDTTAAAAKAAGFTTVESAAGNIDTLASLVLQKLKPAGGALLHAAGSAVAGDLAGQLKKDGFEVRRAVLYTAEPAMALSPVTAAALKARQIDLVVFFSARTAETFVRLARAAGLAGSFSKTVALGLSPQVNEAAIGLPWAMMESARQPQEADVIRAIARHKIISQLEGKPVEEEPEIVFGRRNEDIPKALESQKPRRTGASNVLVWLAVLLALGAGGLTLLQGSRPEPPSAQILRLETRLAALERQLTNQPRPDTTKLDELATRLAALENRPPPATPAPVVVPDAAQAARLQDLEQKLSALEQRSGAGPDAGQVAVTMAENRRLSGELARLQDEVAALGATSARPAAREGLLIAVGQLREALRRGSPFAAELRTVQAMAGDEPALVAALAPLVPLAEKPPATREMLLQRFPALAANAGRLAQVDVLSGQASEGSWWSSVAQRLSSLVAVRRVGDATGDSPLSRLARAERAADAGDLAGTVTALDGLQGPAAETLAPWLAEARARLAAERSAEAVLAASLAAAAAAPR